MTAGGWTALGRWAAVWSVVVPVALAVGVPAAQAKNGDTHITSIGSTQTIDCNESTLLVNGANNTVTALGRAGR
jgi:hypothetical protein